MKAGFDITKTMDAILLAGGESRRMGQPKALLPWRDGTLMAAAANALRPLFRQVLAVTHAGVPLPVLAGVQVHVDGMAGPGSRFSHLHGPLLGIATGLAASDAPWCFVAACDMPFLNPCLVRSMAQRLEGCELLSLRVNGHLQPLHAFYSRACLPKAVALLERGVTAPKALLDACNVRIVDSGDLPSARADESALWDLDTPEQYRAALKALERLTAGVQAKKAQPATRQQPLGRG
ncbi:MAG: molybdenum cofactor guanylyltransferase [Chloroflexi bacterium]|nr:molybdenum cofactor guanylyltransferase [Chloroflexota bacterium]